MTQAKSGPGLPEPRALQLAGRDVPLKFRRHRAARRIILRMDRRGEGVILTLPMRASMAQALRFAHEQAGWISARLLDRAAVPFAAGAHLPLRGVVHEIVHRPEARGTVWCEDGRYLCVAGDAAHLARRVGDFLKRQARAELRAASERHALAMGVRFTRIRLGDPTARWGSCAADGTLSYSWRLIFAPPFVLDYVAAHEVAHLREMNHGPDFWALVHTHCGDVGAAKAWLKSEGLCLQHYG